MSYAIELSTEATKALRKLPVDIAQRISQRIENSFSISPVPRNAIALEGSQGTFRIRVGDYRVLYVVRRETKRILVFRIDKRSRVYD